MDIWMTWAKRKTKCRYFEQPIITATPMVTGRLYRKAAGKSISLRFYWHPQCWQEQGMNYLKLHPYTAIGRGRKKLALEPTANRERYLLLRRHAALTQRIWRVKESKGFPDNVLRIIRLETKQKELAAQIELVGGVPKKWIR